MADKHSGTCHKENWGGYCDCSPLKRRRRATQKSAARIKELESELRSTRRALRRALNKAADLRVWQTY